MNDDENTSEDGETTEERLDRIKWEYRRSVMFRGELGEGPDADEDTHPSRMDR